MKNKYFLLLLILSLNYGLQAQQYFPEAGTWEDKPASSYNLDFSEVVEFAQNNEYSEARDLRQAILKGFEHEPYHELLGPTKERGGPAGMILKKGYLIESWGDIKRVDMTFSVTKSFLSTVGLLALDHNLIESADDKLTNYVWDGTFRGEHNSKITWQHLLQQTSDWSGELWGSYDWADRPARDQQIDQWRARKLHEPGTHYKYNDVRVNVLAYALLNVFRKPLPQVLKNEIMDPIGASSTWRWYGYDNSWTTIDGLKMQSVSGGGHSGGGMFINTEDMARFGLLFLNNGNWNGRQLISEERITEALKPSELNPKYGYMWWLNPAEAPQWEGIDRDIFYAAGFGGNFIIIDRENELVIVTRWLEPSKLEEFMQLVNKAIDE